MHIDPRQLRSCLGHFATGVTVVTCQSDGVPHGATLNAFTAVSMDPPLVLVSLDRRSKACAYLDGAPFTVNVLPESRDDIALHFAGKPMDRPVDWADVEDGSPPRLRDSLAYVSCTPWRSYDGGDHVLYLGEVQEFAVTQGNPLVFYLGEFRHLGTAFGSVPWLESADCPELSWFSLAG